MPKAGLSIARVSMGVLAAGVLGAVLLVAPSAGATSSTCIASGKCFAVAVSPSSLAAEASAAFTFTVTNEASPQTLGSVQISAPPGFVITGASGASSMVSVTSSSATFNDLMSGQGLSPGATTTLTVTAVAACGGGSYQWGIEAHQANDFNSPGNMFQLDPDSAGNLSGTLTGSCSLAFTSDGQPTGTTVSAVITSATGGPVKVEILDGSGQLATGSTAAVTIAIANVQGTGSGSLSGTTTVDASAGVASFSDLSINATGAYALVATSQGITSPSSNSFIISNVKVPCTASSCSASASSTTTMGTVTSSPTTAGEFLEAGIGGVTYSCAGTYQPVSDPFGFGLFTSSGVADPNAQFTSTLEIFKATVDASGHTGASSYEICYASIQPFTALAGTSATAVIGGVTYNTGLLPDCASPPVRPCVQDRHKDNAGDVVVTFLASGDPFGKG